MANYPTSIPSFTNKSAGQAIGSAHMNAVQDEIVAIGSGLLQGTAPLASSNSTVLSLAVQGPLTMRGINSPSALSTGNTVDYNPTGLSTTYMLRLTVGAGGSTISGIAGGASGRTLVIHSANSPGLIWFSHDDANSAAANRIWTPGAVTKGLVNHSAATLWYDDAVSRWKIIGWSST